MSKLKVKELIENNNMKEIEGFPGYFVTEEGKVWSDYSKKWLVINPATNYPAVVLVNNKKRKCCTVHRLVAQAFLPNPENKPEVNHIDGNKLNSKKNNLEWVDKSENQIHAIKMGLKKAFRNQHSKNVVPNE